MGDELKSEAVVLEKEHEGPITLSTLPLGETRQPDETHDDIWTPDNAILPPENLDALSQLSKESWIRSSCVDAVSLNTVGLGYSIEVAKGHEDSPPDDEQLHEAEQTLEALARRDVRLDHPSFTELLSAVKHDEEECGNGAMEVSRSRQTGEIDGLFHAPGKRVRRKKDRSGYIVGTATDPDPSTATEFYNFGEKVKYSDDGSPRNAVAPGKRWDTNELITFRLYTSESRDYGLPRDVELAVEYFSVKSLNDWNASFFANSGSVPQIIFVTGEEQSDGTRTTLTVPQATVDRIHQTLRADAARTARVAIVPVLPGSKVDTVKLSQLSDKDIAFADYKSDHNFNVLGAFRLGPIFVGLQDEGRYTAEVQRALGLEQVFDPEQRRYETRLHHTLLRDLGLGEMRLRFRRLAVEGDAAKRDSADALAEAGAIRRGEYREAHGFGPMKEDPEDGDVSINDEILEMGARPVMAPTAPAKGDTNTDQRGQRPGIGGRRSRRTGRRGSPTAPEVRKEADHNGDYPEYVEEVVDSLERELSEG